jgi:uncharacterized protein (TIGR03083 family)
MPRMDIDQLRRLLADACERFTTLVRIAPDPAQRLRGSDWTVADTAAHLAIVCEAHRDYVVTDAPPVLRVASVGSDNAAALAALEERDIPALVERIDKACRAFLDATDSSSADDPMRWHDVPSTVGALYGAMIGELLVHGLDVGRAVGFRFPITAEEAAAVIEALSENLKWFVAERRARDATIQLDLRGGPSLAFRFAGGALTVTPGPAARPDCRISADPVALLLIAYGRDGQWRHILAGRLLARGRKLWLALGFPRRFRGF